MSVFLLDYKFYYEVFIFYIHVTIIVLNLFLVHKNKIGLSYYCDFK